VTSPLADPDCPRCSGTGWVRVADGAAGAAVACECRKTRLGPALLASAGVPPRYARCTFENFETRRGREVHQVLAQARAACEQYVDNYFSLEGRTDNGLILIGRPGVGKTHLAVATLKQLVEKYQVRGRFLDFSSFLMRLQATFDPSSPESKHQLLDPVLDAELLVFDELAAQKPTPFVQDLLYLIINGRYSGRKPTIFTTNFLLKEEKSAPAPRGGEEFTTPHAFDLSRRESRHDLLSERLPVALVSRIREIARPIEIAAEDFRPQVRQRRLESIS